MPINQTLGDMTTPTKAYCGLPFFDLPTYIEFSELLEKNKIDSILYPKPEGFTALGWSVYLHPLHPDHNASQRLADESRVNRISGLLRIPVKPTPPFDYNSEKQQQSKRIAGHIRSVKANKFYKIISNTLGFKNAYALFRQKQK